MGNEQSAPAPRRPPNKLSKPRTISSANPSNSKGSRVASRRNSQSEHVEIPSNRYSTISLDAVVAEAGEKQREPQRKRTSMFRSRSTQPKVQQLDIGSGVNIAYIESPKEGWSRRDSIIEDVGDHRHYSVPVQSTRPPIRNARMSLQHVPYSQHHPRLSLVPEAPTPRPDLASQRRQSVQPQRRQSVQTREDNELTLSEPLSARTQSETALYAPIRRRSLMQHGVATRNSWIEKNESRQSLPAQVQSQPELQNYYYDPAKPTSSPLTALANLETPKFGDNIPGPRVATPNDLDYGHIGAYKLGSLRITNGAASPAPSIERPATTGGEEDYISAGENHANAPRHRHGLSQRSNTIGVPPEIIKPPWVTQKRTESPLRKEYIEEKAPEPLTIDTHLPLPQFSLFKFADDHTNSPTKSMDLARSYMNDLALSPFSFEDSPPASPRLEATSKHTAVEDDLFEVEPNTPNTSEVSEFRTHTSFDSGYHGERATPQEEKKLKGPRELAPKPLAKADSGYSSNVSLRSFKENKPPSVPAKEAPPTPPKPVRSTSSAYSEASSLYSTRSDMTLKPKRSLPALPVEDETPAQPYRQPPPVPQKHSSVPDSGKATFTPPLPHKSPEQSWAASQTRPNVIMKTQNKHTRSQSIPNVPSVSRLAREEHEPSYSPAGSEVSTSSASSGSTSRWRSRSKSRSQTFVLPPPEPVFTVQAFRTASEQLNIPPVSPQASRSLEERVDAFPVACFPNTERGNNPMRRTPSKETLGTIFSVGSAEWREELTYSRLQSKLPAVPAYETIVESPTPRPDSNRRHTYQPLVSSIPARKPIRQSLPPVPKDNLALQHKLQQDFETQITSFDNISSSLGKSPYDFAISPANETKRKQQEKAKSMTAQFEAEAAARFARARTVSEESQNSQRLQRTTSYDSISNQNPWAGESSAGNSRVSSREYPPQAHGNGSRRAQSMLPPQRSNPNLRVEQFSEENRHSFMSTGSARIKSPPPVSMQTQRSQLPSQTRGHSTQPQPQISTAPAPPPNRTPPQPPAHFSPLIANESEKEVHDPWARQRDFWASMKQEALHSKKSMEKIQGRKSMEQIQSRKSLEIRRRPVAARPSFDNPGPRSESARPSMEYSQRKGLSHHTSFDTSQPWRPQMPGQQSYGCGYRGPSQEWVREDGGEVKGYDHTYGSYAESEKENPPFSSSYSSQHPSKSHQANQGEEEYYDGPSQDSEDFQDHQLQRSVVKDSTSDMLILDRFAGGLGYGYEPGYGLVGSAGTRNVGKMANASRKSVNESVNYGLDFSDVPVFLQRVRVEN